MAKSPRKKSKTKKGKKSAAMEPQSAPNLPNIDPELLKELTKDLKDVFLFKNGDVYVGQFTISGGVVQREGQGKYFSGDGTVLSGRWEGDVLVEAERISHPDGGWYRGGLSPEGRYSGPGCYGWPRLKELWGVFRETRPLGSVTFFDEDHNTWQGEAVAGAATLLPRNHFFDSETVILPKRAF